MSEVDQSAHPNIASLTASFTTLILFGTTFIPAEVLPTESKIALPIVAGIISPYLAVLAMRLFRKVQMDPALIDYTIRLESDLAAAKRALKPSDLPEETRKTIVAKRDATLVRLTTAHQDFNDGTVLVSRSPSDPVDG